MIRTINDRYYVINNKIGSGSYSKVYHATDSETNEPVAIKIIATGKLSAPLIQRLSKEIEILQSLHHPNIISLKNHSITDKHIYMVMDFCNGGTIRDKIGKLTNEGDIRPLVKQILDGMFYLDKMNILHRDLKPDNLLLHNNVVKIIDFGFSSDLKDNDMYSTICGTPMYMSPELLKSEAYNKKSDLWSLGVITYELYHHASPFGKPRNISELNMMIQKKEIYYKPIISSPFLQFLSSILQVDQNKRPSLKQLVNHPWFIMKPEPKEEELFFMDDEPLTEEERQHMSDISIESSHSSTEKNTLSEEQPRSQPITIGAPKKVDFQIIEDFYPKAQTADPTQIHRIHASPHTPSSFTKVLQFSGKFLKNMIDYTHTF